MNYLSFPSHIHFYFMQLMMFFHFILICFDAFKYQKLLILKRTAMKERKKRVRVINKIIKITTTTTTKKAYYLIFAHFPGTSNCILAKKKEHFLETTRHSYLFIHYFGFNVLFFDRIKVKLFF